MMKIKNDFITNSSSTAFIIYNNSDKKLDLVDFVKENPQLIEMFKNEYDYLNDPIFTQEKLIESARLENEVLAVGANYSVFGDEDGSLIGQVFDYILRDGGSSENFSWGFCEYLR
jgi:hypothetical protein